MANKSFGIKEVNIVGGSGTPTIESPNILNLSANTVAVSTHITIGGQLNVSGISTFGSVKLSSGIVTTTISGTPVTYYGDASNVADNRWEVVNNSTTSWRFTVGVGITEGIIDNPVLYLARGGVYEFKNNALSSHPFRIYTDSGAGAAYTHGTTNNDGTAHTGAVLRFEVPMNAPNTLYYRCQNHSGMGNTISIYPNAI